MYLYENKGIGTKLIEEVIEVAKIQKCKRVWLITTNANVRAIRFYQKRGFNMKALYINAVNESRKIKPEIPILGYDNIPILHEIEFEKMI
ncbi:GNAT family N-acetyltransferase [Clostridium tepidiprofundi]|uniref:GNAT family N-acetyltransferase n=1 Tax=Clostridium tepidiprofundi TaxID=420412 RepID=UPI000A06C2AE|nr:GNAT family N-acetyltransferase [Clostridium tepidiprofundi]